MLKAFHAARESPAEIEKAIKKHLEKKREIEKVLMTEEVKEENDPVELGKIEDMRRDFLVNKIKRPNKRVWNFIQEKDSEVFVPHVLRHDANPHEAYIDDRIKNLFELIDALAIHIRQFEEARWKKVNGAILEIFKQDDFEITKKYEEALEKLKENQ